MYLGECGQNVSSGLGSIFLILEYWCAVLCKIISDDFDWFRKYCILLAVMYTNTKGRLCILIR